MMPMKQKPVVRPDMRLGLIVRFTLLAGAAGLLALTTATILVSFGSLLARVIFAFTVSVPLYVLFYCLQHTWARLFPPTVLTASPPHRHGLNDGEAPAGRIAAARMS